MSITKEQLPELIAAAVKRAVEKKMITDQQVRGIGEGPITVGMVPPPEPEEREERVKSKGPVGFQITKLEDLNDPAKIKAIE